MLFEEISKRDSISRNILETTKLKSERIYLFRERVEERIRRIRVKISRRFCESSMSSSRGKRSHDTEIWPKMLKACYLFNLSINVSTLTYLVAQHIS